MKLLQTFVLVAEHSSFRRAAEEVFRSQSAVSMQIKQLEGQLGVPLFHRTTRRVQLTPEGERLLAYTRRAAKELETGLREIRGAADLQRGHATIAFAPTIAASRLPAILARFHSEKPGLTVSVRELAAVEMLDAIRNQEVDFGVGPVVPSMSDFDARTILSDEICIILPPDTELRDLRIEDLHDLPLAMLTGLAALRRTIEESAAQAGVELNLRYEVKQPLTLIELARAGLVAAIVPRIALRPDDDIQKRVVSFDRPALFRDIAIITYKGMSPSPIVNYMTDTIAETLKSSQ